jgi:hypothetical protein
VVACPGRLILRVVSGWSESPEIDWTGLDRYGLADDPGGRGEPSAPRPEYGSVPRTPIVSGGSGPSITESVRRAVYAAEHPPAQSSLSGATLAPNGPPPLLRLRSAAYAARPRGGADEPRWTPFGPVAQAAPSEETDRERRGQGPDSSRRSSSTSGVRDLAASSPLREPEGPAFAPYLFPARRAPRVADENRDGRGEVAEPPPSPSPSPVEIVPDSPGEVDFLLPTGSESGAYPRPRRLVVRVVSAMSGLPHEWVLSGGAIRPVVPVERPAERAAAPTPAPPPTPTPSTLALPQWTPLSVPGSDIHWSRSGGVLLPSTPSVFRPSTPTPPPAPSAPLPSAPIALPGREIPPAPVAPPEPVEELVAPRLFDLVAMLQRSWFLPPRGSMALEPLAELPLPELERAPEPPIRILAGPVEPLEPQLSVELPSPLEPPEPLPEAPLAPQPRILAPPPPPSSMGGISMARSGAVPGPPPTVAGEPGRLPASWRMPSCYTADLRPRVSRNRCRRPRIPV